MKIRRAHLVRLAVLPALAAVAVAAVALRPGGTDHASAAKLSIASRLGDSDSRYVAPTKANIKFTGGRTFAAAVRTSGTATSVDTELKFGQPTIAGLGGVGFEPALRLDPSNGSRMYESAPGSLSSDTSWVWGSADGGKTWEVVPASAPHTGKYSTCAGGGDTELGVDSTGSLYFNDLTLANFSVSRSDDHGRTVTCSNTGVPDTLVDRQWYAFDGDPKAGGALYLVNDEIGPGAPVCGNSTGNNVLVMYRSPIAGAGPSAGLAFGPANKVSGVNNCNEGIMGNNEVSPIATKKSNPAAPLATPVKHVYVIHDDATLTKILIGRCYPVSVATDPSGLSCVDLPVADLGQPGTVKTGANFPTMAIDRRGNLYAVWAQAPVVNGVAGDTVLKFTYSTDEGDHWSKPVTVPTGLANNVMPWIAAGDAGRVAIGFYGTQSKVDRVNFGPQGCTAGGPDAVNGSWRVLVTQSLNALSGTPTFSKPVDASGHPIHHGSIQTLIGGQCGDRTLGDFFQLRVGNDGGVHLSFGDSNNIDAVFAPHAMYVRQVGGPSLYSDKTVSSALSIASGSVADPIGDGTYDAAGLTSATMPNLDITASSITKPGASNCHAGGQACYRVTMSVANMSLAAPVAPDTDSVLIWQTQWLIPAKPGCDESKSTCLNGGKNPMVYAVSDSGGAIHCWVGENAVIAVGGGVSTTYPGNTELTKPGQCTAKNGPGGKITIDVPISAVGLDAGVAPFDSKLWSVTAHTMTAAATPESVPSFAGIGGVLYNQIDAARGYNATA